MYCVDCGKKGTKWASISLGVFLCVKCCSFHRKMGTKISRTKSLTLDRWTKEQVDHMELLGNDVINGIYNSKGVEPPKKSSEMYSYIWRKYVDMQFAYENPIEVLKQNQINVNPDSLIQNQKINYPQIDEIFKNEKKVEENTNKIEETVLSRDKKIDFLASKNEFINDFFKIGLHLNKSLEEKEINENRNVEVKAEPEKKSMMKIKKEIMSLYKISKNELLPKKEKHVTSTMIGEKVQRLDMIKEDKKKVDLISTSTFPTSTYSNINKNPISLQSGLVNSAEDLGKTNILGEIDNIDSTDNSIELKKSKMTSSMESIVDHKMFHDIIDDSFKGYMDSDFQQYSKTSGNEISDTKVFGSPFKFDLYR